MAIRTLVRTTLAAVMLIGAAALVQGQARSQWDGVFTAAQATRGQALWEQCAPCHGAALSGGEAPELAGPPFVSNWNDVKLSDLSDRIQLSMPMNAPGSLSRAQVADLIAYILQKNGAPAGENELPGQVMMLQGITFMASNP